MSDLSPKDLLAVSRKILEQERLSEGDTETLLMLVVRPFVLSKIQRVRWYLRESMETTPTSLALSLLGEFWEDLMSERFWKPIWEHEAVGVDRSMMEKEDLDSREERAVRCFAAFAVRRLQFLFGSRSRVRTVESELHKVIRRGKFAFSNPENPAHGTVYPVGKEKEGILEFAELKPEAFTFPVPKGGGNRLSTRKKAPASIGPSENVPYQVPTPVQLEKFLGEVFRKFPKQIRFEDLVQFLNTGFGINAESQVDIHDSSEAEAQRGDENMKDPANLLAHEAFAEETARLVAKLSERSPSGRGKPWISTFLRFSLWNGLPTTSGTRYGLEEYERHFEIPKSTASDHQKNFIQPLIAESLSRLGFLQKNSGSSKEKGKGKERVRGNISDATRLLEWLREKYFSEKPEFVVWNPFTRK
ncbi:MAG: hypothetical protein LAT55_10290 [Opitutales bacterium]|nr:hypothetical protein [Opitutales bacterium]